MSEIVTGHGLLRIEDVTAANGRAAKRWVCECLQVSQPIQSLYVKMGHGMHARRSVKHWSPKA